MGSECNFISRPMLDSEDACQIAPKEVESHKEDQRVSEFCQEKQRETQKEQDCAEKEDRSEVLLPCLKKEDRSEVLLPCLKVKLPSSKEVKVDIEEDGCITPTSKDHKIHLVCPPAPRKPKSLPSTTKLKGSRRRVLLDLSHEIESLFPPALLADFGNKIKKVRKESIII